MEEVEEGWWRRRRGGGTEAVVTVAGWAGDLHRLVDLLGVRIWLEAVVTERDPRPGEGQG